MRLVVLTRKAPYGSAAPREALDTVLAAAAFDVPTTLVFDGDGAWQLVRAQRAQAISAKNLGANLEALPMFEVEDLRMTRRALEQRGLTTEDLLLPVTVLDDDDLAALLADADQVLSF